MASWAEVRARRLERSGLTSRAGDVVSLAHATAGVHAQVQVSAEIQLAVRCDGASQAAVRAALWEERSLVKAWTLRGTLHLHPAGELALWHAAARSGDTDAPLAEWRDPNNVVHPGLTSRQVVSARAAVQRALAGSPRTREELARAVRNPDARVRVLSGFAFVTGDLVQGPPQGAKVTLARPDLWIDGFAQVPRDEAVLEACRRFLHAYGPSRPADFRDWLAGKSLPLDDARAAFDAVGAEEIDVDGYRAFVLRGDIDFPAPARSVRLLPEYDVYVMGFRERAHLVPEAVRAQVAGHRRGRYEGPAGVRFLLVDGVAAGLWERKKRDRTLQIDVQPAVRLTKAQRGELESEAERIARFFGLDPAITVTM